MPSVSVDDVTVLLITSWGEPESQAGGKPGHEACASQPAVVKCIFAVVQCTALFYSYFFRHSGFKYLVFMRFIVLAHTYMHGPAYVCLPVSH